MPRCCSAREQVLLETTPQQVCAWSDTLRQRLSTSLHQALALAAPLLPQLGTPQIEHVQRKLANSNDKFRDEYLQQDAAERLAASIERATQRAEMLYGPLDARQRQMLAGAVAESPFDAQLWLGEHLAMQAEMLQTLRDVQGSAPQAVQARLGVLEVRWLNPPSGYAAYQQRLNAYNCEVASRLHNSTSQAQRRHARERLTGWEEDLRVLAAAPPSD